LLCVVVASVVQDEEVVEWGEGSRLAHPAEALVHASVTTDHETHCGLHPSCHHHTGPRGRAIFLHMMTFQQIRTTMTSPSTPLRRWRSMSPSAVESLLTLVSMM
jgi:hypothetical protein